ncbi:MAG: phosphotransferase [Oscillospiraceae bacterium]|nr:phosphotransferase [Oscillospiraceae bacterium]
MFLAAFEKPPYQAVVKLYKYNDLNRREAQQLQALAQHGTLKVPKIYHVHENTALVMEFLRGVNAGEQHGIPAKTRDRIGEQIVENLLAYHSVPHAGYGALDAESYAARWRDHYHEVLLSALKKGEALLTAGQIKQKTFGTCLHALERYDDIFQEEPAGARLIHGDYNTWNILLDTDRQNAVAVIDPFNCCWADPEYDLYQLNNANGKSFGLLAKYSRHRALSPHFERKIKYYELFSEIAHYHDAQVDASRSRLAATARELERLLS